MITPAPSTQPSQRAQKRPILVSEGHAQLVPQQGPLPYDLDFCGGIGRGPKVRRRGRVAHVPVWYSTNSHCHPAVSHAEGTTCLDAAGYGSWCASAVKQGYCANAWYLTNSRLFVGTKVCPLTCGRCGESGNQCWQHRPLHGCDSHECELHGQA